MRRTVTGLVASALLAGAVAGVPAAEASAVDLKPEWGSVSAEDGTLKRGCRDYTYAYQVTAPDQGLWDLSVTVVGPGKRVLWSSYLYEDANPAQGTTTFRLCRSKTRPGLYRLKAVVTVQDNNDNTAGRLATERFRLRKPS